MGRKPEKCRWIRLQEALREFCLATHGTTSQRHIKPLHWYIACRLCLEGGFDPEEITPRPPFRVTEKGSSSQYRRLIEHDPDLGGYGEQTILGGLKTKQVDVVVTKKDIGPVVAVSMKGTLNALRNLTNRLEEAGGDCTNLHLTYPSLVYGYWGVIRANTPGPVPTNAPSLLHTPDGMIRKEDLAIDQSGQPVPGLIKYHLALSGLALRRGIRNEVSKYEAVALTLVNADDDHLGEIYDAYPSEDSPVHFDSFMRTVYEQYDLRFVYQAPDLVSRTRRRGWHAESPVMRDWGTEEYDPRLQTQDSES